MAIPGKLQKGFEGLGSRRFGPVQVNILCGQIGEHLATALGPSDQHVQPPLSPIVVERIEVHIYLASGVASVSHANENDVSFVALDCFQVLHEKGLVGVGRKKTFARRVLPPQ